MAKNHISQQDTDPTQNTDLGGISIGQNAMAMSSINDAFREQSAQNADFYDDLGGTGTVGGTADAITLTSAMPALATGNIINFFAGADNTGAATINVNGLGAKAIRKISSGSDVDVAAGDILNAGFYQLVYDAAANSAAGAWILTNPTAAGSGDSWGDAVDADIVPDADGTRDLGATATRFAETYTNALFVTNNITVGGTVDGRDLASDGSKLDLIEASADVTDATNVDAAGAVMEADYNANTILAATSDDTPTALTVAEQTLVGRITGGNIAALTSTQVRTLINVENGADVTDEANVTDALDGATLTDVGTPAAGDLILLQDADDANNLKVAQFSTFGGAGSGDAWSDAVDADIVPDADGTRDLGATATRFAETYTDALFVTNNITVGGTVDGRDLASDGSKLDLIEANADVTDTANVTSAGAVMDSEVTNLALIKAVTTAADATWEAGVSTTAAIPTPANIAAAIAALESGGGGSTTYGDVGTYAFMLDDNSNVSARAPGSTLAGSSLKPSAVLPDQSGTGQPDNQTAPSGTWRLMGGYSDDTADNDYILSLWLRIS